MPLLNHSLKKASFITLLLLLGSLIQGCKMEDQNRKTLPRNQSLPLFNPHRPTFDCRHEVENVPPIDAQADAWFAEARTLEDPSINIGDRDYRRIVQLTKQAAERKHWKAMLNLASLYLEQRDPPRGVEDALEWVEAAMLLGIPAAYDRMGTYHMNGTGVQADATRAYAFWQRAADMGSPLAMAFLGDKLNAGPDSEGDGHWSNIPVALRMLECAFAQGYGPAAHSLYYLYASPRAASGEIMGERTRDTKARALRILHDGVKLGCQACARDLSIEFGSPLDLSTMVTPFVDTARGKRYGALSDILSLNPFYRFPNLDKILPLPPADLPPWDGEWESLLEAAMGVGPPSSPPQSGVARPLAGRAFVDAAYSLRKSGEVSRERLAPYEGYWKPSAQDQPEHIGVQLAAVLPGLYRKNERFDSLYPSSRDGYGPIAGVVWEHWITVPHDQEAIRPQAPAGLIRLTPRPEPLRSCPADANCPVTGVWQPWVSNDHPLQSEINQYWRQAWLVAGQPFPEPRRDWPMSLPVQDLTWHLMNVAASSIEQGATP